MSHQRNEATAGLAQLLNTDQLYLDLKALIFSCRMRLSRSARAALPEIHLGRH